MLEDILISFIVVGLAELGDKTQLCILFLSSQIKKRFYLLLGIILAFFLVDGAAILVGSYAINFIPLQLIKIISGALFLIFGWLMIKSRGKEIEKSCKIYFKNSFLSGFLLIFLTEWGDKTQIASALFAAKYSPLEVFLGVIGALAFLSLLAIYLGKLISEKIDRKTMARIGGIVFIILGLSFFLSF